MRRSAGAWSGKTSEVPRRLGVKIGSSIPDFDRFVPESSSVDPQQDLLCI